MPPLGWKPWDTLSFAKQSNHDRDVRVESLGATGCVLPAATIMAFLALPGFYQLLFLYLEPGEDMSPRASAE